MSAPKWSGLILARNGAIGNIERFWSKSNKYMTKIGKNLNLGIPILKIRYFAHLYMVADNWNISAKILKIL